MSDRQFNLKNLTLKDLKAIIKANNLGTLAKTVDKKKIKKSKAELIAMIPDRIAIPESSRKKTLQKVKRKAKLTPEEKARRKEERKKKPKGKGKAGGKRTLSTAEGQGRKKGETCPPPRASGNLRSAEGQGRKKGEKCPELPRKIKPKPTEAQKKKFKNKGKAKPKGKRGRPKGSKNKKKPVAIPVQVDFDFGVFDRDSDDEKAEEIEVLPIPKPKPKRPIQVTPVASDTDEDFDDIVRELEPPKKKLPQIKRAKARARKRQMLDSIERILLINRRAVARDTFTLKSLKRELLKLGFTNKEWKDNKEAVKEEVERVVFDEDEDEVKQPKRKSKRRRKRIRFAEEDEVREFEEGDTELQDKIDAAAESERIHRESDAPSEAEDSEDARERAEELHKRLQKKKRKLTDADLESSEDEDTRPIIETRRDEDEDDRKETEEDEQREIAMREREQKRNKEQNDFIRERDLLRKTQAIRDERNKLPRSERNRIPFKPGEEELLDEAFKLMDGVIHSINKKLISLPKKEALKFFNSERMKINKKPNKVHFDVDFSFVENMKDEQKIIKLRLIENRLDDFMKGKSKKLGRPLGAKDKEKRKESDVPAAQKKRLDDYVKPVKLFLFAILQKFKNASILSLRKYIKELAELMGVEVPIFTDDEIKIKKTEGGRIKITKTAMERLNRMITDEVDVKFGEGKLGLTPKERKQLLGRDKIIKDAENLPRIVDEEEDLNLTGNIYFDADLNDQLADDNPDLPDFVEDEELIRKILSQGFHRLVDEGILVRDGTPQEEINDWRGGSPEPEDLVIVDDEEEERRIRIQEEDDFDEANAFDSEIGEPEQGTEEPDSPNLNQAQQQELDEAVADLDDELDDLDFDF